ncbi:P-II family nitrogen regulator [Thioalkalivibrio paradoxus]|uniref:Nitrogen regulatory protein P-II n=1 Tax=Thioalkalivibrio paradoxus ARh 1 TaxID=713585 RepID=W0DLW1_9GAMM|nr:hypothetical protein [Thioalkalivibrio paradoxus]AHE99446.1 nitrogen regulatory protein P-II [Thioalkalivibrio paradoxus ARh 1]
MKFSLIMVFVDDAHLDSVLDEARAAGATGATIINNAQGQGLQQRFGIFGLELMEPRSVALILVEKRRADTVLDTVSRAGHLDETLSTGIALELDVARAVGLTEHVKTLAEKYPP